MPDLHPRIRELLEYLDASLYELRTSIAAVPEAWHSTRPTADEWSAAEVVEHLAVIQERLDRAIGGWIAEARAEGVAREDETSPILPTMKVLRIVNRRLRAKAPEMAVPTGTSSVADSLARLERGRERFRETLSAASGLALSTVSRPHFALGELSLYEWVAFIGAHERRHAAQIDEVHLTLRARQLTP